jgi:peptide/nickel transport system substrate-binding protein
MKFTLAVLSVLMGFLIGPAWGADPTRVTVVHNIEPNHLVSAINPVSAIAMVSTKIHDMLLAPSNDGEFKPALAESWTSAPDGKMFTFKLRPNIKWHDGEPFTAKDVVFTAEAAWRRLNPYTMSLLKDLTSVAASDDLTVTFELSRPVSPDLFFTTLAVAGPVIPAHAYGDTDISQHEAIMHPIGTGPFKFKEWERGSYIRLERNPDYWADGQPGVDELVFRYIRDEAGRAAALETGEAQVSVLGTVALSDVERLKASPNLAIETRGYAMSVWHSIMEFNLRREPFNDVRVRQAIAHAIDLDLIARTAWVGLAKPSTGPIPSQLTSMYTTDGVPLYPVDVEKAEKMLDEAGWPKKADGTRFKMNLVVNAFTLPYQQTAQVIAQALTRIGIDVQIENMTQGLVRRIYTDYDFDAQVSAMALSGDPSISIVQTYWTKGILPGANLSNASGYSNPEMDSVIEAAAQELSTEKRVELFKQFQAIAQRDLPLIPLVEIPFFTIHDKRLVNTYDSPRWPMASWGELRYGQQ